MTPRTLPIINAIGCLALTGVVLAQWRKERALEGGLAGMGAQLTTARDQSAGQAVRCAALERDIAVLRQSLEATQQAAESSGRTLAEKDLQATQLQTELDTARQQLGTWQTAIKTRDERIHTLDAQLAAARTRLDEAIAKLKAAGAR